MGRKILLFCSFWFSCNLWKLHSSVFLFRMALGGAVGPVGARAGPSVPSAAAAAPTFLSASVVFCVPPSISVSVVRVGIGAPH